MSRIDSVQRAAARRARSMTSRRPDVATKARATLRHAGSTAPALATGWDTARERVTPVAMAARDRVVDAYDRMSTDYMPRATDAVEQAAQQVAVASEPYRAEVAARGAAALAALRGEITPADVRRIAHRGRGRRIVLIALLAGAAAAAGSALVSRRRKDPSWVADTDDAAGAESGATVRSLSERAGRRAHDAAEKVKEAAARAGEKVRHVDDGAAPIYADGEEIDDRAKTWP